eukprot:862852_1
MDQYRKDVQGMRLVDFLNNAWYRREFREYLKDDVVILSFYETITEFRQTLGSMDRKEQHDRLKKIYDLYISDTAPFSLKLRPTARCVHKMEENFQKITQNP